MTQAGLIGEIVATAELEERNPSRVPAAITAPGPNAKGEPWDALSDAQPDIRFAVGQAARVTFLSHIKAVRKIMCRLAGTLDKRLVMRPDVGHWAEADFAGTIGQQPSGNVKSVKSQRGHVITSGGAPPVWKSQSSCWKFAQAQQMQSMPDHGTQQEHWFPSKI